MDPTDRESFVTALSEPGSPHPATEAQQEPRVRILKALEAVSSLQKALEAASGLQKTLEAVSEEALVVVSGLQQALAMNGLELDGRDNVRVSKSEAQAEPRVLEEDDKAPSIEEVAAVPGLMLSQEAMAPKGTDNVHASESQTTDSECVTQPALDDTVILSSDSHATNSEYSPQVNESALEDAQILSSNSHEAASEYSSHVDQSVLEDTLVLSSGSQVTNSEYSSHVDQSALEDTVILSSGYQATNSEHSSHVDQSALEDTQALSSNSHEAGSECSTQILSCPSEADTEPFTAEEMAEIMRREKEKYARRQSNNHQANTAARESVNQSRRQDLRLSFAASQLMPTARLLLAFPPSSGQLLSGYPVIPLNLTIDGHDLYAVVQGEDDADVAVPLPGPSPSARQQSSNTDLNRLRITFDTKSNTCYLDMEKQVKKDTISFIRLETGLIEYPLGLSEPPSEVSTGAWRISVNNCTNDSSTIDILVRERQFTIDIFKGRATDRSGNQEATDRSGKREATDHLGHDGASKRQKGSAGETISNLRKPINETPTTLENLQVGNSVMIRSSEGSSYRLTVEEILSRNFKSQIYKCSHSGIPKLVAAKVFCYSPCDILEVAERWKKEKSLLQLLDHKNIVKLLGVDGRILTLYHEFLPPTLESESHTVPFSLRDTLAILRNMSSALEYLALQNIIHGDIKPHHIAFSRSRGAVLLDFESSNNQDIIDGTSWYMPPEVKKTFRCDHAGDMWALGVTMLYVTGLIPLPELNAVGWSKVSAICGGGEDSKKMDQRFSSISAIRSQLAERGHAEPQAAEIYSLIYQMLNPIPEERIGAAELHAATKKLRVGSWIHRCNSPVS